MDLRRIAEFLLERKHSAGSSESFGIILIRQRIDRHAAVAVGMDELAVAQIDPHMIDLVTPRLEENQVTELEFA